MTHEEFAEGLASCLEVTPTDVIERALLAYMSELTDAENKKIESDGIIIEKIQESSLL